MAPLPTTYTVELHPDQVPTVWRFAGYDGNSPEDELASLIRSGIEVRIRRMRQERKTAALGTDCPLCGARAGWPPSEGEPCRDWRPGGKEGETVPVARPWRDDLHTERVACVIAPGRWPQRNEEFLVSLGVVQPGAAEVPVPPSPGPRRREGPVTGYAVIAIKAEAASDDVPRMGDDETS